MDEIKRLRRKLALEQVIDDKLYVGDPLGLQKCTGGIEQILVDIGTDNLAGGTDPLAEDSKPAQRSAADVKGASSGAALELREELPASRLPHARLQLQPLQLRGLVCQQVVLRRHRKGSISASVARGNAHWPVPPGAGAPAGLPARCAASSPASAPARDPAASRRSGADHVAQLFAEDMRRRGYFAHRLAREAPAARSSRFGRLAGERRGDRVRLRSFATPAAAVRGRLASPPPSPRDALYRYAVIGAGVANGLPIL